MQGLLLTLVVVAIVVVILLLVINFLPLDARGKRIAQGVVAIGALVLLLFLLLPRLGAAQERVSREQLRLAALCVSESGWDPSLPDCAAIHEVISGIEERTRHSYLGALCAYSGRTCDPDRGDHRRWIANLRADGRKPDGWPGHLSWSAYAPRWQAMLEHAGDVLAGRVESPCRARRPRHWGAPDLESDLVNPRRYGWEQVDCGESARNLYYAPSRVLPASVAAGSRASGK